MKNNTYAIITTINNNNDILNVDTLLYWSKTLARKKLKQLCYRKGWTRMHDDMVTGKLSNQMEDLEQTASRAILEMYRAGLIKTETDLFAWRKMVYRAVENEVSRAARDYYTTESYTTVDENGNEYSVNDRYIDAHFREIEKTGGIDVLYALLDSLADKRVNRKTMKATFYGIATGKTLRDIQNELKCALNSIERAAAYIRTVLNRPEVYEYLNMVIHDNYTEE